MRPWCVRFHQDIDGLANAFSNIIFKYLMVSCYRSVEWWEAKCKGIKYVSQFTATRAGSDSGSYVVHVFSTLAATATPVAAAADTAALALASAAAATAPTEGAAHTAAASLLNPGGGGGGREGSFGEGEAAGGGERGEGEGGGGKRTPHPRPKMDMVRSLSGLEKSMAKNVIVLGGALNGLTCAHTLPSRTRAPSRVTLILPPVLVWRHTMRDSPAHRIADVNATKDRLRPHLVPLANTSEDMHIDELVGKEKARVEQEPASRYFLPPSKAELFNTSAFRKAAEVYNPVPHRTSPHLTAPHLVTSSPPHHTLTAATRPPPLPSSPRHSHQTLLHLCLSHGSR
jgi:hypothetical protein